MRYPLGEANSIPVDETNWSPVLAPGYKQDILMRDFERIGYIRAWQEGLYIQIVVVAVVDFRTGEMQQLFPRLRHHSARVMGKQFKFQRWQI
jgi:hypothetical protein